MVREYTRGVVWMALCLALGAGAAASRIVPPGGAIALPL